MVSHICPKVDNNWGQQGTVGVEKSAIQWGIWKTINFLNLRRILTWDGQCSAPVNNGRLKQITFFPAFSHRCGVRFSELEAPLCLIDRVFREQGDNLYVLVHNVLKQITCLLKKTTTTLSCCNSRNKLNCSVLACNYFGRYFTFLSKVFFSDHMMQRSMRISLSFFFLSIQTFPPLPLETSTFPP